MLPLSKMWDPFLNMFFNPLHPRVLCAKFGWFWRKRFFQFHQCLFAMSLLFSIGKGCCRLFEQTYTSITKGCFVPSLVKIKPLVLLKKIFFISLMRFCYIVIIFPWKTAGSFIWTNLNPLHPRMLCAKFGWNWLDGSWEQDKNVKSFQNDRWKDDRQQAIRKAHWSFQLSRS